MAEELARKLFRSIARAFYDDDVVVVADALTRSPYVMDDEKSQVSILLQTQFSLQSKQVRKSLQTLHLHQLIEKVELDYKAPDAPKGTRAKKFLFWYINYFHFVKIVRLRIAMMEKIVTTTNEKKMVHENNLMCPRCNRTYNISEVISRVDSEGRFYCANCQHDTFETVPLVEVKKEAEPVKTDKQFPKLISRIQEQLKEESGLRPGILDILSKIDVYPRPPSDNDPKKLIQKVSYEAELAEIEKQAGGRGGGYHGGRNVTDGDGNVVPEIVVNIQGADSKKVEIVEATPMETLAPWMSHNVSGTVSSSAVQDARERLANQHAKSRGVEVDMSQGGAGDRLKRQRGEIPDMKMDSPKAKKPSIEIDSTATVMVGGKQMLAKDVTTDDQNKMSDEEYKEFMRIFNADEDEEEEEDFF